MVLGTFVALLSLDVGQASTLARGLITEGRPLISSQTVAHALDARLLHCIAVVAWLARFTRLAARVVQTFQALASGSITAARYERVNVVVALALGTLATRYGWIAEIVLLALVAPFARVTFVTIAQNILTSHVQPTGVRVRHGRTFHAGTRTTFTRHRNAISVLAQWVTVESFGTFLAIVASRVLFATNADARFGVAQIGESIAIAAHTTRIVPIAWLTFVTSTSIGSLTARALASGGVTINVFRSKFITIAS